MKTYTQRLKEERIYQSVSRKGNCHDNAVMENFFGLLKQEIYYGVTYCSYEELKPVIEDYIRYYNEDRIKEKLGWKVLKIIVNITLLLLPNRLTGLSSYQEPLTLFLLTR
ncbi:MAG: IS3 family transposase [Aerococcus sp.]|nr:IS3 family transposase [Aerococcus sp.]